tara:strand:+ start:10534 stop:11895 length:1362 start_codon:yes stop_codon:yes gene_type:complete
MILFKEFVLRLSKVKNIPSSLVNIFLLINWKKESIFQIFKDNILNEEFLMDHDKEILLDLYISVIKLISRLKSIVRIYKYKKAVKYDIDTDLHLNPLEQLPENQKILLLENNTLYHFKLRDLLSCWKLALLNSQGLFSKPIQVKNPYTNLPIKNHNLYNIYFKCLNMYINLPLCITNFFKCNMNIDKFQLYYFTTLKEVAVINFMNTNNYYEMFEQVLNLLHDHRKLVDYVTFTNYCPPTTRIKAVKKFKPILINYLLSKYSCNPIVKDQKLNVLKKQLTELNNKKDDFGFDRGFEVMRYVPLAERTVRTEPPPPPPLLVTQLRNRRTTLRRRRRITRQSIDFSESDSDDISDLDIVENNQPQPQSQEMNTISVAPPPPINVVIPQIPPPVTTNIPRPTNPPPPPPNVNPFVASRQLPRTPIRNNNSLAGNSSSFSLGMNFNHNNFRYNRRIG